MSKTSALEPESSKAKRMEDMMFSALASAPEPISPTMDTMAVCGELGLMVVDL